MRRYAIVLGGGRSQRMGTNKMALQVGGRSLLERTVSAALTWAEEVVVAAPQPDDWVSDGPDNLADFPSVHFTLEDPPYGGPAAGIKAAVAHLEDAGDSDQVLLLAGDLAHPDLVVAALEAGTPLWTGTGALELKDSPNAAAGLPEGVILEDPDGWAQHLAGIYTLGSLRGALTLVETARDLSVRKLLSSLTVMKVQVDEEVTADLDTPEDLCRTLGPEAR